MKSSELKIKQNVANEGIEYIGTIKLLLKDGRMDWNREICSHRRTQIFQISSRLTMEWISQIKFKLHFL